MKVLIIEDEWRAANQLKKMLDQCDFDHELLEVLDTVESSVAWFTGNKAPDLIFMDIQLADGLSFEIFQSVKVVSPIIFTTAFDQYAIQAFKVNSIDYLLKPIKQEDLAGALEKFLKRNEPVSAAPEILAQLLKSMQVTTFRDGILVKEGSGFVHWKVAEALYFHSEDSITFGVSEHKRYIIEETMDLLYGTLDPAKFFRINRGQIVSKAAIRKIDSYFNHRLKLSIAGNRGQEFIVSRAKSSEFKMWINK